MVRAAQVRVAFTLIVQVGAACRAWVGITKVRSLPVRSATTGPTISGITSPAFRNTTVSPTSTPFALAHSHCARWPG